MCRVVIISGTGSKCSFSFSPNINLKFELQCCDHKSKLCWLISSPTLTSLQDHIMCLSIEYQLDNFEKFLFSQVGHNSRDRWPAEIISHKDEVVAGRSCLSIVSSEDDKNMTTARQPPYTHEARGHRYIALDHVTVLQLTRSSSSLTL